MIPKTIHYCWFGRGELPPLAQKCIASWKKYCPDYEIIQWNEDNFDLNCNEYVRYCYENKKWAFLSDYVRLAVVKEHGGLYFDTDVELIKSPDRFLEYDAFFGFENSAYVNTGQGFGCTKEHPIIRSMLEQYHSLQKTADGGFSLQACPALNTAALCLHGLKKDGALQNLGGVLVLPAEYMNPFDNATGTLNLTARTVSIHWYSKSWLSKGTVLRSKLTRPFHRLFGNDCFAFLKR